MSRNAQWLPGARRRGPSQPQDKDSSQPSSLLVEQALLWDAYEARHMFDTRRNRLAKNFFSSSKKNCEMCWSQRIVSPKWLPASTVLVAGAVLTCSIWLSEKSSLAGLPWPWSSVITPSAATNVILILLSGVGYALFTPHMWRSNTSGRPHMPLRAKELIYFFWLGLNLIWLFAGIRQRDFRKPSWLKQTRVASRTQHFSEPVLGLLRLMYGVGMASAWPLLANLFVMLLPVDRSLFLLASIGVGHEQGVLVHALCGSAVWIWAAVHAILTQAPMLAAGLWRLIVLPPLDGSETKATANFMGLMAFLSLCGLGVSSLARIRRRSFNSFQMLHLVLAPAVLLFGCLHVSKVFWYSMLGFVLYTADLVQRWVLRRRTAIATASIYPLRPADNSQGVSSVPSVVGGGGNKFVLLRIHTGGIPDCVAGQHVFIKVPAVSRWEWHPYSVATHDDCSFTVIVKAGGDWELRLCRKVELDAAAAAAGSVQLDVTYEGLYGTPDLQFAATAADRVLLFAGGVGITPIASVLQALLTAAPLLPAAPGSLANDAPGYGRDPQTQPSVASEGSELTHHQQPGQLPSDVKGFSPKQASKPPSLPSSGLANAGVDVWAGAAEAVSIADVVAGMVGRGARVRLVWAVTQQSDTEPLLPLLLAATTRGWAVDVHCTRPSREPLPAVSITCKDAISPSGITAASDSATTTTCENVLVSAAVKPPAPQPVAPWRLHGALCWGIAAVAALFGAMGMNIASTAASSHSCKVGGPSPAASGSLNSTTEWLAAVHAAFRQSTVEAASLSGDEGTGSTASAWARLAAAVLQGSAAASVFRCPLSLLPSMDMAAREVDTAGGKPIKVALKAVGVGDLSLRICRTWGAVDPELCVMCDPFKPPDSELLRAWPCCQARVCFFASRLAPLLGWVAGLLVGAALACMIWQRWNAIAAGAGHGVGRHRLLLAVRGARHWFVGSGGTNSEATAKLLPGDVADVEGSVASAANPSAMEADAGPASNAAAVPGNKLMTEADRGLKFKSAMGLATDVMLGAAREQYDAKIKSEVGIQVHAGRPDVEAYIRAAAAAGDAAGCGRYGRTAFSDEVYGVVVCGPESLQAAVQVAFSRHLQKAYPESWFRGFSFTT